LLTGTSERRGLGDGEEYAKLMKRHSWLTLYIVSGFLADTIRYWRVDSDARNAPQVSGGRGSTLAVYHEEARARLPTPAEPPSIV
jgi:hypothetical protein